MASSVTVSMATPVKGVMSTLMNAPLNLVKMVEHVKYVRREQYLQVFYSRTAGLGEQLPLLVCGGICWYRLRN